MADINAKMQNAKKKRTRNFSRRRTKGRKNEKAVATARFQLPIHKERVVKVALLSVFCGRMNRKKPPNSKKRSSPLKTRLPKRNKRIDSEVIDGDLSSSTDLADGQRLCSSRKWTRDWSSRSGMAISERRKNRRGL